MGFQTNYGARLFSRGTKAQAVGRTKGRDGIPRCRCGTVLTTGKIRYDHIIPWEICHHSGPSNCQALCVACHDDKTFGTDLPLIAAVDRVHDRHIGALRSRHPMPCGRGSRLKKPIGAFRPVRRVSQVDKMRALIARLPPRRPRGPAPAPAETP